MKNTIIVMFILAVVFFTVGLYVGASYENRGVANLKIGSDKENTFAAGWEAARNKLKESGALMAATMGEVKMLSGDVVEAKGGKIVFNAPLLNPLDDESLKVRTAIISDNTKIIINKQRTPEEMEKNKKENDEVLKGLRFENESLLKQLEGCSFVMPMEEDPCAETRKKQTEMQFKIMEKEMNLMSGFYKIDNAKMDDIKEGYFITITSDEDVSIKKEFKITKIEVTERMAPLAMPNVEMPAVVAPLAQ